MTTNDGMKRVEGLVTKRILRAIDEGVMPGGVLGIVTRRGEQLILPFGGYTYDETSPRVSANTMYDVASLTKAIPGSMILLKLLDEGRISLDDRLVDYVPEFDTDPSKRDVCIRHVLTYTLDLKIPGLSSIATEGPDRLMQAIMDAPLAQTPGTRYSYNNSTAVFIHRIAEKVTGQTIDVLADNFFFEPLQMARTTFYPEQFREEHFPPTELNERRGGEISGVVHDDSTFVFRQKHMVAIAGLFASVPDILIFLEMILRGGELGGRRYISDELLREIPRAHIEGIKNSGLGWEINEPYFMGERAGNMFGKTGFTGCAIWVEPKLGVSCTLLSNATYPTRGVIGVDSSRNILRRDLANIIFSEFAI